MIGRRKDGRLNHKPLTDYVPGVPLPSDEEALFLRQPNTPEEEARCEEYVRAKAAEIRAANLKAMRERK
jgi:hypothetical protein